jgi:hypothetical protein
MPSVLHRLSVRTQEPDYEVAAEAVRIGADLLVYIWGGERPHIGSVAAAQPRPSSSDPRLTSATASVFTYLGHKEDVVTKYVAETLSARLGTNVVVTAGIHWDNLTGQNIDVVIERCREITNSLVHALQRENNS